MHIYSQEEFEKKQLDFVKKNIYKPVMPAQYCAKKNIIKNYIYYDEPIKLF